MAPASGTLCGPGYRPTMFQEDCEVLANRHLGAGHFLLTAASKKIARRCHPGQFVNVACEGGAYLRRPFSFHDVRPGQIDLFIRNVGLGTGWLERVRVGQMLDLIGPLGKGFGKISLAKKDGPVTFITGGVGYPPLHHLYLSLGEKAKAVRFIHGVRSKAEAAAYQAVAHPAVLMVSEDGSTGHKGRVTDFTADVTSGRVYACGPEAMLEALHHQLTPRGVQVIVSMESPMGCGFGVCFGCSLPKADGTGYLLCCVDGPVFDSRQLFPAAS